jgi:hypothetical protein
MGTNGILECKSLSENAHRTSCLAIAVSLLYACLCGAPTATSIEGPPPLPPTPPLLLALLLLLLLAPARLAAAALGAVRGSMAPGAVGAVGSRLLFAPARLTAAALGAVRGGMAPVAVGAVGSRRPVPVLGFGFGFGLGLGLGLGAVGSRRSVSVLASNAVQHEENKSAMRTSCIRGNIVQQEV